MTLEFQGTARYRVNRRLGAGGMGVVYEAEDLDRGGQRIALKLLKHQDPASLMRLKREFRALADVAHANLVQLYELVVEQDTWFFTLEHVEGVDFLAWVRAGAVEPLQRDVPTGAVDQTVRRSSDSGGALDLGKLRAAFAQLVSGVAALHAAGRLHRDLKPSNVLVTPGGQVKILDFGLVAELTGHESISDTQSHQLVGTAPYMAPEQAASAPVSAATDWYSVGVMMFQALTGTLPFDGGSMQVLIDKQKNPAPHVRDRSPHVPEDLARLVDELLLRDPERRPKADRLLQAVGGAVQKPQPATSQDTGFVGRAEHLETLRKELATAKTGTPRVVAIIGSSGIGKSALARRFMEEAATAGAVVLAGRCYERESVPFKALDSAIDVLARRMIGMPIERVDAILPRDASVLARMFPVLKRVPSFANAPVREVKEAADQRRRAVAALRELFARMTDRSPVIMFIDDVQWSDDDSAQVLVELLTPPDAPSVLWITAARELGPAARELPAPVTFISLEPLNAADARELAQKALGTAKGEQVTRLAQESGGNPFLLQQLAAHPSGAEQGLDGVVRARLLELDAPARALLEVVAVAGHPLEERVAVKAAQLQPSEWGCALTLKAAHLLKTSPGDMAERYEAWHDRIRENIVASLDPKRQAELHARLADALEELQPEKLDAAAMHLTAAGQSARAAGALIAAANRAADTLAFESATQLYAKALEQLPPDDLRRRALTTRMADALADCGRGQAAAKAYQQALKEPGEQPLTPAEEVELARRAGEQLLRSGHVDEGLEAIDEVCRSVGFTLAKSPWRAAAAWLVRRAHLALRGLDFKERPASEVPTAKLQQIDVCWSVSVGLSMIDTIRGASFQSRQLLLALDAGEPYRVARALSAEAAFIATAGISREARVSQLIGEARKIAERVGDGKLRGTIDLCHAIAMFLMGRWRESIAYSAAAEQGFKDLNAVTWEAANARLFSVWSLFYIGEIAELQKRVPALVREAESRGDLYAATSLEIGLANVAILASDEPKRARDQVRRAMSRWGHSSYHFQHYWAVLSEGMIDLYEGQPRDCFDRMREAWPMMKRAMLLHTQNVRIEAQFLRARAALACGELGDAISDAERLESEKVPWGDAFAAAIRGLVAIGCEDREMAAKLLQQAILGFEAADMRLFAAATRIRLGEIAEGSLAAASIKAGEAWMLAQGVRTPTGLTRMLMPMPKSGATGS